MILDDVISNFDNNDELKTKIGEFLKSIISNPEIKKLEIEGLKCVTDAEEKDLIIQAVIKILKSNNPLESLSFSETPLSYKQIEEICDALKENRSIKSLTFHNIKVTEESDEVEHWVEYVASLIENNKTIKSLGLPTNELRSNIKYIFEALNHNQTITDLDFGWNILELTTELLELIKNNTTLHSLDISYTDLNVEEYKALTDIMRVHPSITEWDLSSTACGSEDNYEYNLSADMGLCLIKAIKENKKIEKIILENTAIPENIYNNFKEIVQNADGRNLKIILKDEALEKEDKSKLSGNKRGRDYDPEDYEDYDSSPSPKQFKIDTTAESDITGDSNDNSDSL